MNLDMTQYDTIAFDCDGIILDSNKVKTQAFFDATAGFSEDAALAIKDYHIANGGISRFKKFEWVIKEYFTHLDHEQTLKALLYNYAEAVYKGLIECRINPALATLKQLTPHSKWLVVSGGAQSELRDVFEKRQLTHYFPNGIFGSPDSKDEIFAREIQSGNISGKALFIGDSKYDFTSSSLAGLDFIFVSQWTEVKDWPKFCADNNIQNVEALSDLQTL